MTTTPLSAVLHILSWEQLNLIPRRDAVGKLTGGWGHKMLPGEHLRERTRQDWNAIFLKDLAIAEAGIAHHAPGFKDLSPGQFGALVSFCFNAGHKALGLDMGLGRALHDGRLPDVPAEMRRWVYSTTPAGKSVHLAGLVTRREGEVALWNGGD